jgi:hypothetical protein
VVSPPLLVVRTRSAIREFGLVSRFSHVYTGIIEIDVGVGLSEGVWMPKLGAEEAERRDALVFQLYLAGMPYRQIAARPEIRLSVSGVQLAIDRARARREDQRSDIGDVTSLLIERYEQLVQIAYRRAANGELRANDQCRKLLVELGGCMGLRVCVPLRRHPARTTAATATMRTCLPSRSTLTTD